MGDLYLGEGKSGGTGGGYHFIVFVFSYLFCILLSHVLSIFI